MSAQLTPHHHQLMRRRLEGKSNEEIAKEFKVSLKAIGYHFGKIHKELQTTGRCDLIPKYYEYRREHGLPVHF